MPKLPTACVIGAGSSGIAAVKALHERGVDVECFEKSDRVGGNWVFRNTNGMSSAYKHLHINTSRERMEYSDFPMPKEYPDFPHHTHIAEYFAAYVERFGLGDAIRFETGVERAERRPDGVWEVTDDHGETHAYDALLVANGHHWDPRWPEPAFPGQDTFPGEQVHAHHYVDAEPFTDRRVLVVGIGNSAMDIATETSYVAEHVTLSSRRSAWVLPKYLFGKPLDQIGVSRWTGAVPFAARRGILELLYKVGVGDITKYGLPIPDHKIGEAHPTISADFLNRIGHGEVTWRPNIARIDGSSVRFADGTEGEFDVIVWCTGYKVTFPFFAPEVISAPDNDLPLYRRVFHPEIGNVFFVGLLQPLGAIMPLAEAQGRWITSYLRGEYHLPAPAETRADIERERARMFKRYVASKRHTMQVDFDNYLWDLGRELRRGAARARATGFALPVAPRAGAEEALAA